MKIAKVEHLHADAYEVNVDPTTSTATWRR